MKNEAMVYMTSDSIICNDPPVLITLWCLFSFQRCLVELICSFFVASWTGVVKYHGPRPSMRPKQVLFNYKFPFLDVIWYFCIILYDQYSFFECLTWAFLSWFEQVFVANHTSMIDFIILEQMTAFAVIMQKHPGWVGQCQCCYTFP